jgi:hypothetical protein
VVQVDARVEDHRGQAASVDPGEAEIGAELIEPDEPRRENGNRNIS